MDHKKSKSISSKDAPTRKLRVYFFGDNTGVGWYRIHSPAKWIKKLGLAEVRTSEWRWTLESEKITFPSIEELEDIGFWADLIVFQRHDTPQHMANFMGLAEHFNIPIILDTDDNIEAVRPYNPGYAGYHPGSEATEFGRRSPRIVDAVTVTTKELFAWHEKDNKNRYILPNSLDCTWRGKFKKGKHPKGEVHFGCLVSAGHYENLIIVRDAVIDILKKYPHAYFHTMEMYGTSVWDPKNYSDDINRRIVRHHWATLKDWPKFIADLGLDFALAPAVDNLFNRAKSNLRYLEYSFYNIATIASPTACYACVKDGETGLFAKETEDWFDAMERLIENPKLLTTIQKNAHEDVVAHYNMEKNAHLWVECYEDVVAQFKKTKGSKHFKSAKYV